MLFRSSVASTRLDMEARHLDSVVRASVHYYNVTEELDRAAGTVAEIAARRV